jgi:hypothetical protein
MVRKVYLFVVLIRAFKSSIYLYSSMLLTPRDNSIGTFVYALMNWAHIRTNGACVVDVCFFQYASGTRIRRYY